MILVVFDSIYQYFPNFIPTCWPKFHSRILSYSSFNAKLENVQINLNLTLCEVSALKSCRNAYIKFSPALLNLKGGLLLASSRVVTHCLSIGLCNCCMFVLPFFARSLQWTRDWYMPNRPEHKPRGRWIFSEVWRFQIYWYWKLFSTAYAVKLKFCF